MTNTLLPDMGMVMAFCFRGRVRYRDAAGRQMPVPFAAISGIRQQAGQVHYAPGTGTLLVKFTATGSSAFFTTPPSALRNHTVALDELVPRHRTEALCEGLSLCDTNAARALLAGTTLSRWLLQEKTDPLVQEALRLIRAAEGTVRIRELAAGLYISQDPFEKRFRRATGTSPKHFADMVRMRTLIGRVDDYEQLGSAAHASGFFDQAHFIRSFKAFAGTTPKAFFREARYW